MPADGRCMAGLWVVMMTVRLHLMGVALRRVSLASHGTSGARAAVAAARRRRRRGRRAGGSRRQRVAGADGADRRGRGLRGAAAARRAGSRRRRALAVPGPGPASAAASAAEFWSALPAALALLVAELRLGAPVRCGIRGGVGRTCRAAAQQAGGSPRRGQGRAGDAVHARAGRPAGDGDPLEEPDPGRAATCPCGRCCGCCRSSSCSASSTRNEAGGRRRRVRRRDVACRWPPWPCCWGRR